MRSFGSRRADGNTHSALGETIISVVGNKAIAAITLLYLALLVSYSIVTPLFQAPDETAHIDLMVAASDPANWSELGGRQISQRVLAARSELAWQKEPEQRRFGDAPQRENRPTFIEVGPDNPSGEPNAAAQHPPLYYVVGGIVGTAIATTLGVATHVGFDQYLSILRLLNVLLLVPLPALVYHTARRLDCVDSRATVAAIVPVTIPQLSHIGASVNNDNLLVLSFGVGTYLVARILTGDRSAKTATLLGIAVAVGLLAKVFALVGLVWIVAAYLFAPGGSVSLRSWAQRWRPLLVAGGTAAVLGGWWWVRNILFVGALQPRMNRRDISPPEGFSPNVGDWALSYWRNVGQSFWGDFNYLNIPLPAVVVALASAALLVLAGRGLLVRSAEIAPRSSRVLLALPLFLLIAGISYQHYSTVYLEIGRFPGSQGRYFFAGVPVLAVLAGIGTKGGAARFPRATLLGLLASGLALQAVSIHQIASSFFAPAAGWSVLGHFRTALAWSPWAGEFAGAVWLTTVLLVPLVAWTLWAHHGSERDPSVGNGDLASHARPIERGGEDRLDPD